MVTGSRSVRPLLVLAPAVVAVLVVLELVRVVLVVVRDLPRSTVGVRLPRVRRVRRDPLDLGVRGGRLLQQLVEVPGGLRDRVEHEGDGRGEPDTGPLADLAADDSLGALER